VVAHRPRLIEERPRGDGDWRSPGMAAIGRAAHDDRGGGRGVSGVENWERRDEPDAVAGIVRDRWVAHAVVASASLKFRDAGQEPARPRRAAVRGRGPADV